MKEEIENNENGATVVEWNIYYTSEKERVEEILKKWLADKFEMSEEELAIYASNLANEVVPNAPFAIFDSEKTANYPSEWKEIANDEEMLAIFDTIEKEKLKAKSYAKARRKYATRRFLTNVAIFAFVFTCLRIYGGLSFDLAILQTILIQFAIGFVILIIKYMKFRKS